MSLWYLKPSIDVATAVNDILFPVYCSKPAPGTLTYIPIDGRVFPFQDGDDLDKSVSDPLFTSDQQAMIQNMLDGKKSYTDAVLAGWIQEPNDF